MSKVDRLQSSPSLEIYWYPTALITGFLQLTDSVFDNRQLRQNPRHSGSGRDFSRLEKSWAENQTLLSTNYNFSNSEIFLPNLAKILVAHKNFRKQQILPSWKYFFYLRHLCDLAFSLCSGKQLFGYKQYKQILNYITVKMPTLIVWILRHFIIFMVH